MPSASEVYDERDKPCAASGARDRSRLFSGRRYGSASAASSRRDQNGEEQPQLVRPVLGRMRCAGTPVALVEAATIARLCSPLAGLPAARHRPVGCERFLSRAVETPVPPSEVPR